MEQTIEKYSFMLRMQSIDLSNTLFGKACRECSKHGPVQEVRPHKYVEQWCFYCRYHDDDGWRHHRVVVWLWRTRPEVSPTNNMAVWPPMRASQTIIHPILMFVLTHYIDSCFMPPPKKKPQKTPDCAKICSKNLNLVGIVEEVCTIYLCYTLRIVVKPPVSSYQRFLMWQDCFYLTFAI